MRTLSVLAILTLTLFLCAGAVAAPLTGGSTSVTLTDEIVATNPNLGLIGTATLSGATVSFPITGGEADPATLAGTFEHAGSGLSLTDGGVTLSVENLLVDTVQGLIFADIVLNGTMAGNAPVLAIGSGLELTLTAPAIAALSSAFNLAPADLEGLVIGTASIAPEFDDTAPIPEPSTWMMLLTGMAAVGLGRRAFQKKA
ncbi:MAG: PEP-CTERM sorting domain-containing protein [Bryobacterales bacterium]|nr:PEP-CTERM sorting domain-containing protein [Bryobacterales bacterium]